MAYIISADEIKKTLHGYDPEHSDVLHRESARLADKKYEDALKKRKEKTVILMSGGTASGKTEYISAFLKERTTIIFDGTMPTLEGAKIKINKALRCGKRVEIHAVLPTSLETAFIAFLNRDRKFPPEHFYKTHSSSRQTLLEIARKFPEIPIEVVFSDNVKTGNDYKMTFTKLLLPNRGILVAYLAENQYTEDEIKRIQGLL